MKCQTHPCPPNNHRLVAVTRNCVRYALAISILGFASPTLAQTDQLSTPDLHAMDCAWWDYVAAFAYEDYVIFEEARVEDPMAELKYRMEYDAYHSASAGRAMLDSVFSGINAGAPLGTLRQDVATLCLGFPAKAVHPDNVHAPMLGQTL